MTSSHPPLPSIDLDGLEQRILREIPLSNAMKVRVRAATLESTELLAPLQPNINHEGTAFGGSVSAIALLSCWALVNVNLDTLPELDFDYVVVQDSEMKFLTPIETDFTARASIESAKKLATFLETLKKHKRARITLKAEVSSTKGVCATLEARFVAQAKKEGAI